MALGPAIAGRIVRRGELHVFRARPRKLARARADVRGTCSVFRSLDAQLGPCSRPARRTVPSKMQSFIRAGWASVLEHDLSTEDERRTIPFYQETARPEKREWMAGSFFSVEGRDWCLPVFRGTRPVHPRRRQTPCHGRTLSRQNRQSGPKVCRVRPHLETLSAGASEFRRHRHRRNGPRNGK